MRRAEVNSGSQPVRNRSTNPGYETVTGSLATVRTNLCPYPNMTATGAAVTVRTNLCTNPRGVFAMSEYQTGGTTAITPNVAVADNPDGFTTANRVAYSTGGNPGVTLVTPLVVGTTYTMQAWIKHESVEPTTGTCALAHSGVGAGTAGTMTVGAWQKLTWTFVSTSTNAAGFRVTGQAGGTGAFLITGVMVEASGYVSPFFDGASTATADVTYLWTGTANASSSQEQGVLVSGWSPRWFGATGGNGVSYKHSTDAPIDGPYLRKVWKIANTGAAQDVGLNLTVDTPVTAGKLYSFSITTRCSIAQHMTIFAEWRDSGGALISSAGQSDLGALTPNVWQRFANTITAPAGAVTAKVIFGPFYGAIAMPAGTTLDFDQCLIEEGALGTFFTGNYPSAGDFTYAWSGTANASTSIQRGIIPAGVSAGGCSVITSADWFSSGTKSIRIIPTNSTVNDTWLAMHGDTGGFRMGIEPGKTYTAMATSRLAAAQTGTISGNARQIMFFYRLASGSYTSRTSTQAPNAVGVTKHSVTATIPSDATEAFVRLMNGASAGNGEVWWDDFMLVEGNYTGDFINPAQNTFAKWDGAANASTSVGYPPQLYDIAGKPNVDVTAPATYVLDDSFAAGEGRTFYTVIDTLAEITGSISPIIQYGDNALSDTVPNTWVQLRQDNNGIADGANNLFLRRTGGTGVNRLANVRRHVSAWGINNSAQLYEGVDGAIPTTDTGATMSLLHQKLVVVSNDAFHTHIRTIGYRGVHDDATRLAIARYLGNKYGINVP